MKIIHIIFIFQFVFGMKHLCEIAFIVETVIWTKLESVAYCV
jgi:hypothetical protein